MHNERKLKIKNMKKSLLKVCGYFNAFQNNNEFKIESENKQI